MTDENGNIDSTTRGRVVPRESDERKLHEWNDYLQNGGSPPGSLDGVA